MSAPPPRPTLAHLPLPLLAMPMGTGGVGLAWREAARALGAPAFLGEALLAFTALLWLALVLLFGLRLLAHPRAVMADLRHPVRVAFAAAPTIGLMIVSVIVFPYAPAVGAALWSLAVFGHLLVAMMLLRRIVAGRGDGNLLAPPLLIPLVGNVLAPVFGAQMGFIEAAWMMFGIGVVLWLVVMPLLLHRLVAGPPLPSALRPSLVILAAPPAVAATALAGMTGRTDGAVLMLAGIALLVAAVLLSLAAEFARIPFALPWWGMTFPAAALAIMLMVADFPPWLSWPALLGATALTAWIAWRTLRAALAGAFFRPEG